MYMYIYIYIYICICAYIYIYSIVASMLCGVVVCRQPSAANSCGDIERDI